MFKMLCTTARENLTMMYRSTLHESTDFSSKVMMFKKEMYMPVDVMMTCPDSLSNQNELEYIQGLRDSLKDAYDVAREHLQSSASRHKRYYDIRADESPYGVDNEKSLIGRISVQRCKCGGEGHRWC